MIKMVKVLKNKIYIKGDNGHLLFESIKFKSSKKAKEVLKEMLVHCKDGRLVSKLKKSSPRHHYILYPSDNNTQRIGKTNLYSSNTSAFTAIVNISNQLQKEYNSPK